jgi:uncharacterized cupin superfamily protein
MADRSNFKIVHKDDCERNGGWLLARRSLGLNSFGLNIVEIQPGESIPEHDETGRDQEEVFFIVAGNAAVVIDGTDHPAPAGTLARLDPELRRTVRNTGDDVVTLLIASAPRSSGYEPMEWA